jgi:hypothetical protein
MYGELKGFGDGTAYFRVLYQHSHAVTGENRKIPYETWPPQPRLNWSLQSTSQHLPIG